MYLIAMQKGGYQAIPIRVGDKWDFSKLLIGKREVRIILRVRGRRYLLYHTRDLAAKYPDLKMSQMTILCDEIIAKTSECIASGQKYIEFEKIIGAAECRHQRRWRDQGLSPPAHRSCITGTPSTPKRISWCRMSVWIWWTSS